MWMRNAEQGLGEEAVCSTQVRPSSYKAITRDHIQTEFYRQGKTRRQKESHGQTAIKGFIFATNNHHLQCAAPIRSGQPRELQLCPPFRSVKEHSRTNKHHSCGPGFLNGKSWHVSFCANASANTPSPLSSEKLSRSQRPTQRSHQPGVKTLYNYCNNSSWAGRRTNRLVSRNPGRNNWTLTEVEVIWFTFLISIWTF